MLPPKVRVAGVETMQVALSRVMSDLKIAGDQKGSPGVNDSCAPEMNVAVFRFQRWNPLKKTITHQEGKNSAGRVAPARLRAAQFSFCLVLG
jgi:hypothetical protein